MRTIFVLCATLASASALHSGADARTLRAADPYDARIIAANNCNSAVKDGGFTEALLTQCKGVYDATVSFERSARAMTRAQKSTLAIAKGLSMLTISGGYTKLDGVLSARACKAVEAIDLALVGYDPAASNGLEDLYNLLANTRDAAIPKCRIGGHWPG